MKQIRILVPNPILQMDVGDTFDVDEQDNIIVTLRKSFLIKELIPNGGTYIRMSASALVQFDAAEQVKEDKIKPEEREKLEAAIKLVKKFLEKE